MTVTGDIRLFYHSKWRAFFSIFSFRNDLLVGPLNSLLNFVVRTVLMLILFHKKLEIVFKHSQKPTHTVEFVDFGVFLVASEDIFS